MLTESMKKRYCLELPTISAEKPSFVFHLDGLRLEENLACETLDEIAAEW